MASILYKNQLIVSHAVFDEVTQTWKPQIQLTLTLDREQFFDTKAEAERVGIGAAKAVIDTFDCGRSLIDSGPQFDHDQRQRQS